MNASNGQVQSSLLTQSTGVIDVVSEPGANLSVHFQNASGQSLTQTVDSALLGINHVVLHAADVTLLGTGLIQVQVTATDPAGNVSPMAYTQFTVI